MGAYSRLKIEKRLKTELKKLKTNIQMPVEDHDVPVDLIITEKEIVPTK